MTLAPTWQGVTIQILSGRSNSLAFKFAIFLEKHLTGLLAGSAFAPYKRFTTGKTLAQGEFTSPEHIKTAGTHGVPEHTMGGWARSSVSRHEGFLQPALSLFKLSKQSRP